MKKKKIPRKRPKKHFGFDQIYDGLNMGWIPVWTRGGREISTPMNMPSDVTINGQKFRVRYRTEIYSAPKKTASLDGMVIFPNRLILIDPEHSVHEMRETLYHEMCHIYLNECQKKDIRLIKLNDREIEGICDMFGAAVYDLALNNPLPK